MNPDPILALIDLAPKQDAYKPGFDPMLVNGLLEPIAGAGLRIQIWAQCFRWSREFIISVESMHPNVDPSMWRTPTFASTYNEALEELKLMAPAITRGLEAARQECAGL